jgi:hypothetical protein
MKTNFTTEQFNKAQNSIKNYTTVLNSKGNIEFQKNGVKKYVLGKNNMGYWVRAYIPSGCYRLNVKPYKGGYSYTFNSFEETLNYFINYIQKQDK